MSKLFTLKEWLTVADAARHLSIAFGEDLTIADVLRLALDGHLKLSVNFVNYATGRCGKIVPIQDSHYHEFPSDWGSEIRGLPEEARGKRLMVLHELRFDDKHVIEFDENVTTLKGVWDLPMIGTERLDIEHYYQQLTGGPPITLQNLNGAFVDGRDGQIFQLQESYDKNEYQAGSRAQLKKLKQDIANNNLGEEEAESLLSRYKEDQKKFLERQKSQQESENYYPAGSLPEDSVIVVRTQALRDFEQSLNGASTGAEKPMTTSERNSLLTIIAALCNYSKINHQKRGAAGQIAKLTANIGAPVSDDTLRRVLAKIPDALESRM
jgi:hypothetical protein